MNIEHIKVEVMPMDIDLHAYATTVQVTMIVNGKQYRFQERVSDNVFVSEFDWVWKMIGQHIKDGMDKYGG